MPKKKLLLTQRLAFGDAVLVTAVARDIAKTYDDIEVHVNTHAGEVWDNNLHVKRAQPGDEYWKQIVVQYGAGITAAKNGLRIHMLAWYYKDVSEKLGRPLAPLEPCGDLHLTEQEKRPVISEPYWLAFAGGKTDAPVKIYPANRWQTVVDKLFDAGIRVAQVGAVGPSFINPTLNRVIDHVGRTKSHRELLSLIYNASGVISPISAGMHIAACFDKPCVVIAGGREDTWWEQYTNEYGAFGLSCRPVRVPHVYLHTIGKLFCCRRGCWKHNLGDPRLVNRWSTPEKRCQIPETRDGITAPACMNLIEPETVVSAVLSYGLPSSLPAVGSRASITLTPSSAPMPVTAK